MLALVLSLVLLLKPSEMNEITVSVSNGGQWGTWGVMEKCPPGTTAKGFSLKVEPRQGFGDDTSLNGIRLHCVRCEFPHNETMISSESAQWGEWGPTEWCPYGFLSTFCLRVEEYQERYDETSANNIKFKCSDSKTLEGKGLMWGSYGAWSESCRYGICGIRTRVEPTQGKGDDTALNDVQFVCCDGQSPNQVCS